MFYQTNMVFLLATTSLMLFFDGCKGEDFNSYSRIACEGTNMTLSCLKDQDIKLTSAKYGLITDQVPCPDKAFESIFCQYTATSEISKWCNGKQTCEIKVDSSTIVDPCPAGVTKHLIVDYLCLNSHRREKRSMKKKTKRPRKM
ncbi:D-galactoside-specific lectin-like [Biomphalaria glabrata]|uniref:D-galactoside-specific lectin-like n=1 Tax=Biomphalaria glabrata TaxID=6526 RepID=A0A9W3AAD9_BIOGL|nr:D-galactoside-specific lectin-like [Biomphalaria glabrata]